MIIPRRRRRSRATRTASRSGNQDVGTYCYDAATGNLLWSANYNGLSGLHDGPVAVKTSPDGTMVFVLVDDSNTSYAAVAYDATSGHQLWVARYMGVSGDPAGPNAMAVSPDGTKLFVAGGASTGTNEGDWATVAFSTSDGAQLWVQRYHGPGVGTPDVVAPADIAVSPDGSRVVVTGYDFNGSTRSEEYATVSYAASSGTQQWASAYGTVWANATGVVISPDGCPVPRPRTACRT